MLDIAAALATSGIDYAVVGAMAAAVHGVVRASLDADAVVSLQVRQAVALQHTFDAAGLATEFRIGDPDDPIPALLAITDSYGNRVDLLIGLHGLEPGAFARAQHIAFLGESLRIIGREDFIAMKAFAGGPQDLSDARLAIAFDRESLDLGLLRRLAERFGREAAKTLDELLASGI